LVRLILQCCKVYSGAPRETVVFAKSKYTDLGQGSNFKLRALNPEKPTDNLASLHSKQRIIIIGTI